MFSSNMRVICLLVSLILLVACSSTEMLGSWVDPEETTQFKRIYIIGLAQKESNKRLFEDTFKNKINEYGIDAVSSYEDFAAGETISREAIIEKMQFHNCDAVLLTKILDIRNETVISPGRVERYDNYSRARRPSYYNNWDSHYSSRSFAEYTPPKSKEFVVLTLESSLYSLKSKELVWGAQFETFLESDLKKVMLDFVVKASNDLKRKGLI